MLLFAILSVHLAAPCLPLHAPTLAKISGTASDAASGPYISFREAETIALNQVGGGQVKSIERDTEWRRIIYEVEVVDSRGVEWDVEIDAKTGQVISVEED